MTIKHKAIIATVLLLAGMAAIERSGGSSDYHRAIASGMID